MTGQVRTFNKSRNRHKTNGTSNFKPKTNDRTRHEKPKYKKKYRAPMNEAVRKVNNKFKPGNLVLGRNLFTKNLDMRKLVEYDAAHHRNHRAYMIYATKGAGGIAEYAGRVCYNSFDRITATSYEKFVTGIVKSGHESVIEHSNLIFIIPKPNNPQERHLVEKNMLEILMYNGLLVADELWPFYILSGNIRMFKDLYRKFMDIKKYKTGKKNEIIEDILMEMYLLPQAFFSDFILNDYMQAEKFVRCNNLPATNGALQIQSTESSSVDILNQDKMSDLKYSYLDPRTHKGTSLYMPKSIMERHLRTTFIMRMPRYTSHQLVRHRLASYSQASQRYITEKNFEYSLPHATQVDVTDDITKFMETEKAMYKKLMDVYNLKAEDARCVLSNNIMTSVVMTMTGAEIEHFIEMRTSPRAQEYIREYIAKPMQKWYDKHK